MHRESATFNTGVLASPAPWTSPTLRSRGACPKVPAARMRCSTDDGASLMNSKLPLTEAQERRLTVTLARLEQTLVELAEAAAHPPPAWRLTRNRDPLEATANTAIQELVAEALRAIQGVADDLRLPARETSIRQRHSARLQVALVELLALRPSRELRACGPVNQATAAYLEAALPKLEEPLERLLHLIQPPQPAG